MSVLNKTYYYFIGIGGIGMSALARYFKFLGKEVLGYDRSSTDLTIKLENEGIEIHYEDDIKFIPKELTVENTLVIYTPAEIGRASCRERVYVSVAGEDVKGKKDSIR